MHQRVNATFTHIWVTRKIARAVEVRTGMSPLQSTIRHKVKCGIYAARTHVRILIEVPLLIEIATGANQRSIFSQPVTAQQPACRSEERRVGKEARSRRTKMH